MNDEKHERRDRFSWGPGDIEIIKAPETKPTRKPKAAPAVGDADTAEDEASPPHKGDPRNSVEKG